MHNDSVRSQTNGRQESRMSITFQCDCGKKLQVADHYAGKKGRCPSCGATLDIPDESNAEVPSKELRASDFDAAFDEYRDSEDREGDRRKQDN